MFADEMREQPQALRDVIAHHRADEGLSALAQAAALPGADTALTFTGMGSSLYASHAVLPALWRSGRRAAAVEAGEILHYGLPGWQPDGPLVAVSQSGESAETRALAETVKGSAPILAVTNEPDSSLAQAAAVVLPMKAGQESAISTKTYTNTLAVLHLLKAALLGEDLGRAFADLEACALGMESALRPGLDESVGEAAKRLDEAKSVHFIGRGPCLAATHVGALTIGEGARVTAVGLPGASFRHGPLELADEHHAAVLFLPNGPTRPLMEKLWNDLARVGSRTVALTEEPIPSRPGGAVEIVLGPAPSEAHFPLLAAMAVERILAATAARRNVTPGDFRYGGKVTDEE